MSQVFRETLYRQYSGIAAEALSHLENVAAGEARSARFIIEIDKQLARFRFPVRLRDGNIPDKAIDRLAADEMLQSRLLVNTSRELTGADTRMIYRATF